MNIFFAIAITVSFGAFLVRSRNAPAVCWDERCVTKLKNAARETTMVNAGVASC